MAYSIFQDIEEINKNPDKWINHGRNVLIDSCKHHTESKEYTNTEYLGYCEKCDISEDSAIPMINYIYPLELKDFDEDKILKVAKETNCSVLENQDTNEWFLVLCGGGMDLSQDIAYAYQILETWIPQDLLREVCKQANFSLGSKNYKKLSIGIIKQLKMEADSNKQRRKEWKESLKNLRANEKVKKESK